MHVAAEYWRLRQENELRSNQTLADDHDDPWPEDTSC